MHLYPEAFYHIYNRTNARRLLFTQKRNYSFFLSRLEQRLLPHIEMVAYCLMPTHFHLLVYTPASFDHKACSEKFKWFLSGYAKAINAQEGVPGNLFQQNTKAKELSLEHGSKYPFICFQYIHQNPIRAGLEKRLGAWPWSSYAAYAEWVPSPPWLSRQLAYDYIAISEEAELFVEESERFARNRASDEGIW